jgi:NitT/TauT family transport system ATP-binding protein
VNPSITMTSPTSTAKGSEHRIQVHVKGLNHAYNKGRSSNRVLSGVEIEIAQGEIVAIVGPSGCGKSTLLQAMLGILKPTEGGVYVDDHLVTRPNKHIGIVFQKYSLFDWLTATGNVAEGPFKAETSIPWRMLNFWRAGLIKKPFEIKAREYLEKFNLSHVADSYPDKMSGGQQQRVAIAQSLIMRPSVLLLDEPFGALDESSRKKSQTLLLTLYQENQIAKELGNPPPHTIIIVTHQILEAIYVADRVIGLSQHHPDGKNGACVVYDKVAPTFAPDDKVDWNQLVAQEDEIAEVVFNEKNLGDKKEWITFWSEVEAGRGTGVMKRR